MKRRVWLFYILICCLLFSACAMMQEQVEPVSMVPAEQDTLQMKPDFSYVVTKQLPHIFVNQSGYGCEDKKVAFFYGKDLQETFEIRDDQSGETVYSGTLHRAKESDGKSLYTGIFTDFCKEGHYYVYHEQVGDSYVFQIDDSIYNRKYEELEKTLLEKEYEEVSEQAYLLANYMFIGEMFADTLPDDLYIRAKIEKLLYSQDVKTGAFIREVVDAPVDMEIHRGTISLSTTAQMAGVLAQYVYLYREKDDPVFLNQCLQAAHKAYRYVEQYRDNTDTDAWYFAATQLYRTSRQYKYRNSIVEYDTLSVELRSTTEQGYTILADFTYLATPIGTDYNRCVNLLDGYLNKAQSISTNSSRENFYVLKNIDTMSDREILEDMYILGVVNHVLSGQEYAGIQKNYIHYLSGLNRNVKNYMEESILVDEETGRINTANSVKMLVIYGNLYCATEKTGRN